jgi:hypothetical protein
MVLFNEVDTAFSKQGRGRAAAAAASARKIHQGVCGFILASPRGKRGEDFYIDIVCVKTPKEGNPGDQISGKVLIDLATRYAKANGFNEVSLSAIVPTLTYYPRLGFEFRDSCSKPAVPLPPTLKEYRMSGDNFMSAGNKPLKDFILTLHEHGLEANAPDAGAVCKKRRITKAYFDSSCHVHGYSMKKCKL